MAENWIKLQTVKTLVSPLKSFYLKAALLFGKVFCNEILAFFKSDNDSKKKETLKSVFFNQAGHLKDIN